MTDDAAINRKWLEQHPDFLFEYLDTVPSDKLSVALDAFFKKFMNQSDRSSRMVAYVVMNAALSQIAERKKSEKAGTFQLKPPLRDEELPPYLRRRVLCFRHCGRTFRADDLTLKHRKDGGAEPDATYEIAQCLDDEHIGLGVPIPAFCAR
jgi:hypothetical protein